MNRSDPTGKFVLAIICIVVVSALLLAWISANNETRDIRNREEQLRKEVLAVPVNVQGKILAPDGTPLEGARLSLQEQQGLSSVDGSFFFAGINRTNSLLTIMAPGFRAEFIPVHLFHPLNVSTVKVDPVRMEPSNEKTVRLLFAGDTHFGRRFIDPLETTPRDTMPPDNQDALILVSDPEPGTRNVLRYFRPLFQEADFSSVNLESPVLRNVSTPHREKEYVLFTLPGSLPALTWLGVDYVSTGNNHAYDYLEQGITDTLENLRMNGIPTSGAGSNTTMAFQAYRAVLKGTPYAFLSMNSIDGSEHGIRYIATESKGGSANLKDSLMVNSSIRRESAAGYIPIVQVHGGDEYTYQPSDYIRERMYLAARAGADLVVSHHPHIAQGVEVMDGAVVIEGLGNFAFDAERLETELGLLARVDMEGSEVRSVRLIPVYLQNATPRPVTGRLADLFLRRIGEFSQNASYPVFPYNGQGIVTLSPNMTAMIERTVLVNVTVPDSGILVLDLRQWADDDESLAEARDTSGDTVAQIGRDLMLFGDFEDWDLDEDAGETDHWDLAAGSATLCMSDPYEGSASLCSVRYGGDRDDSVIPFRHRIRVTGDALNQAPNKNLSFIGYIRGEGAGPITIVSKYFASEGEIPFGEEEILSRPGGTFPWQLVVADIHMPADDPVRLRDPTTDPRALQIIIRQSPPGWGRGIAEFDEIAVVSWEETISLTDGGLLSTPHARDFLRISSSPGAHQLTLKFRSFTPQAAET